MLMPMAEYDIGAGGIMVHCRANAKYKELSSPNGQNVQKDVQKDDSIDFGNAWSESPYFRLIRTTGIL